MEGTAHFISYFTQGRSPVMRFVSRVPSDCMETWTDEQIPGPRYDASKPVFVLTSHETFSGGEELAYDFQAIGRAKVVGEASRGGGRAPKAARVSEHFVVGVPYYEGLHAATGKGWNGLGVKPDVPATAAESQTVAYRLALEQTLSKATDPVVQTRLRELLSGLNTK
jgi:C-terminal processing protease CtpA/Prc